MILRQTLLVSGSLCVLLLVDLAFGCASSEPALTARSQSAPEPTRAEPVAAAGVVAGSAAPEAVSASDPTLLPTAMAPAMPELCDVVQLKAAPQVPDVMIVLDRSASMLEGGRWQPSVAAVRSITQGLQAKIRFGLAMFPDVSASNGSISVQQVQACDSAPDPRKCVSDLDAAAQLARECTPGRIRVPFAANAAAAIASVLDDGQTQPSGGTPTSGTLEALLDGLSATPAGPDAAPHPKFVLLVTDGAPSCPAGKGSKTTPADVSASNAAIAALAAHDVHTFVVGYDTTGASNEELETVLDGFAQRGGTGDQKHRPVEDEASLQTELQSITTAVASCSLDLDKPLDHPERVLIQLDGKQVDLGAADGWRVSSDRTVELVGHACEQFRNGTHSVSAAVQCQIVQPL